MPFAIILHQVFFGIVTFVISVFLILLVLVQRGRGGGLTGALGGPGGQSAFGTKAGDVFTRITVVTAGLWIFFCALGVWWMQQGAIPLGDVDADVTASNTDTGLQGSSDTSTAPSNSPAAPGLPGIGAAPTDPAAASSGKADSNSSKPKDGDSSNAEVTPGGIIGEPGASAPTTSQPKPESTGTEPNNAAAAPSTTTDK